MAAGKPTKKQIALWKSLAFKRPAQGVDLLVALLGPTPPVWRRLRVRDDITLDMLHAVIQISMGWQHSHLHQFEAGRERFVDPSINGPPEFMDEEPEVDERKVQLREIARQSQSSFLYTYDFGDGWTHAIVVEQFVGLDAMPSPAVCLGGGMACPPEDCGGVSGHHELKAAMKRPNSQRYKEMVEWLGQPYDATAFDLDTVNEALAALKWPRTSQAALAKILPQRDERASRRWWAGARAQ